jgi:hypothetical protein
MAGLLAQIVVLRKSQTLKQAGKSLKIILLFSWFTAPLPSEKN